jgi:CheY-like chemotaxis protein
MGLAMVQGIVKDHQGFIRVESAPDEGTRVEILLPTIQGDIFASSEAGKNLVGGCESILFVDDEANLAELGEAALERLGYQVEARTSPDEALALFSRCKDEFDLVVTDLSMPRMNGDSLTRRIQALRPDIPVILCTGNSENVTPENAQAMGIKALLMKPLSMQELSGTVRAVLDQHGSDLRQAS